MKVYIVTSGAKTKEKLNPKWSMRFSDAFALKVLEHLRDDPEACTGCGKECTHCRLAYKLDMSKSIAGVHWLPDTLLYYVDEPEKYLPKALPPHDLTLAINVHEDILLALPQMAKEAGAKAVLVPVEDPDWLSKWGRQKMAQVCSALELEAAFPKPFCSLEPGSGPTIDAFISEFRMGKPELNITVKDGVVRGAKVLRSAPCGSTYFMAHNIRGKPVDEKLFEWVAKYWHSYPCLGSMKMDYELADTILHKGGYNHYDAVEAALKAGGVELKAHRASLPR